MESIFRHARRVIFERGIEFVKEENWKCVSLSDGGHGPAMLQFALQHDIKPILLELDANLCPSPYGPLTVLCAPETGKAPMHSLVHELCEPDKYAAIRWDDRKNMTYIVSALIYHTSALAVQYSRIINQFLWPTSGELFGSERVVYSGNSEPYYEFDALVTAAIRALDAARKPLWHLLNAPGSVPSSFKKTLVALEEQGKIDAVLLGRIESLRKPRCERAKEYRDCIQHYVSPGATNDFALMEQIDSNVWGVWARLPDNPEVRSASRFTFNDRIDALEYGWRVAYDVQEIVRVVLELAQLSENEE